jgi:hypothetical protein
MAGDRRSGPSFDLPKTPKALRQNNNKTRAGVRIILGNTV